MSNAALEVSMHAYNVTDSFVNYGMWKIGSKSDSHTRKICGGLEGEGVHSLFLLTLSAVLNFWLLQYLLTYVLLLLEAMGHVLYFFVYLACSALCQTNNLRKFLKQKELRMDELKILVLFLRHLCLLWVQPIFFFLQFLQSLFFAESIRNIVIGRECHWFHNRDRKLELTTLCVLVAQSYPICDPRDCSLPGSPVHGILQTRMLGWVAISFSRRFQIFVKWILKMSLLKLGLQFAKLIVNKAIF